MAGISKGRAPFIQGNDWFTVAPSDTVDFKDDTTNNTSAYPIAAVWVGTGGDIALVSPVGNVKTFKNVPNGTMLPFICKRVNNTNTTASNIIGVVSNLGTF
jgi:hypothetical protein